MEEIVEKIRARIAGVNPDGPRKVTGVFQINVQNEDGTSKTITVDLNKLEVQDEETDQADVVVDVDTDTFIQVAKNEISFCDAMKNGKASFTGDAELAKTLGKVICDKPLTDDASSDE